MGKKSPRAPNPWDVAHAQTDQNINTARAQQRMNLIDQYTPFGNLTYQDLGGDRWASHINLSPQQQALMNQENSLKSGLFGFGQKQLQNMQYQNDPLSSLGPLNTSQFAYRSPRMTAQDINLGQFDIPQINLPSGLMPNITAPNVNAASFGTRPNQEIADRLYKTFTPRLDERFSREQSALDAKLANQGIDVQNDAWRNAQNQFGQTRNDAYNEAQKAAQQAVFQDQAIQAQVGAANASNATQASLANAAREMQAQMANAGYSQDAINRALQTQQLNAGYKLAGRQQQYGEASDAVQRAMQAQQQNALLGSQDADRAFQQYMQGRGQGFQESQYANNLPLQYLQMALSGGGGAQIPQFGQPPGVNLGGVDLAGLINNNYQGRLGQYQATQGNLYGLAGAGLGALGTYAGSAAGSAALAGFF